MDNTSEEGLFDQSSYTCRLEWGSRGIRDALQRNDVVILVDVLSFSSATVAATAQEAWVYPYAYPIFKDAKDFAGRVGAELLNGQVHSPSRFGPGDRGKRYVFCTRNGGRYARLARHAHALLAGCLLNADAVAEEANRFQASLSAGVAVIACGERWKGLVNGDNWLRPCMEDYLGAGAILSGLTGSLSPEAAVCAAAFQGSRARLEGLLWDCGSGRELRAKGLGEEVRYCARLNSLPVVPRLVDEHFENRPRSPSFPKVGFPGVPSASPSMAG